MHGLPRGCASQVEQQLLRIGQEAVVNAVRHAGARAIHAEVRYDDATVTLLVTLPGYIGTRIRYTIRLHHLPRKTTRCTQPGSTRPRTTCS